MYALTLHPQWAFAIANLDKRVENRPWKPAQKHVGTYLAIHAGRWPRGGPRSAEAQLGMDELRAIAHRAGWRYAAESALTPPAFHGADGTRVAFRPAAGAIVAVAELTEVTADIVDDPWAVPQCYHWRFGEVLRLATPVPAVGQQRLWCVTGRDAIALAHQVAGACLRRGR